MRVLGGAEAVAGIKVFSHLKCVRFSAGLRTEIHRERSTFNVQRSALNVQRSTFNAQRSKVGLKMERRLGMFTARRKK